MSVSRVAYQVSHVTFLFSRFSFLGEPGMKGIRQSRRIPGL
jgi:hypothetical protein